MSRSRALLNLTVLGTVTPPLMVLQWFLLKLAPSAAVQLPRLFHRNVCRVLRIRIKIAGTPVDTGPCLLAANHTSWLDIPILSAVLPVSFVAKKEVNGWPLFGSLARLQRSLFVDRDRRSTTGQFRDVMQARLGNGDILVLFPEGTSSDGNRVLPFKSALMGAADMQLEESEATRFVQVQPVSVAYTHHYGLPMGRRERPYFAWYGDMEMMSHIWTALKRGPFDVEVRFHEPVTVAQAGNRKLLAAQCEEVVRDGLIEAITGQASRK